MHLGYAKDRGLAESIALNWRLENERRYVIVIGDASAYPEEQDNAIARALRFATKQGQHVSAVMVARREAEAFLRQLAAAGLGGVCGRRWGESMIASVLLAILEV